MSWGLSDQVSFQAEFQGTGFDDLRTLSNSALLWSTLLVDERLILFGRGTTGNGYAGALGTPGSVTVQAVSASMAPGGTSSLQDSTTYWVSVAADAGDLLGTNGYSMHQGPATVAASVTVAGGQAIQVTIGTDVPGALGYNLYVSSVNSAASLYYQGRTGYNVGYITSAPTAGPYVLSGGGDQSAVGTNFDGLLTACAASGGINVRLNSGFSSTSPGSEYQGIFGQLYESVKGDPETLLMNGFDRAQLSNALISNAANAAYRVMITTDVQGNVKAGTVVTSLLNETTGSEVNIMVHPFMPQGVSLVRQETLPIPQSNVSETSYFAMVQDMMILQWPAIQLTYDSSSFQVGTLCNIASPWQATVSGIAGTGIGVMPPSYGDA